MSGEPITLRPMTREMYHELFRDFHNDPATFDGERPFEEWVYDAAKVDAMYDRQLSLGRVVLAVMLGERVVGEIRLRDIDRAEGECVLGIHLQSDEVKGRGIGSTAERLAADYAFDNLGLRRVKADCIRKNVRSQRALEKAGFIRTGEDARSVYYQIENKEQAERR